MEKIKKLVNFFFEIGILRKTVRAHRPLLLTDDLSDSIASHSFRSTVIGWFLAFMEKADENKVIKMCLIHDFSEARSGDQNWINKKYVQVFEKEISQDQFSFLPRAKVLLSLDNEYNERITLEARIAKDADLLDQILLLREHSWQGNREADFWLKNCEQAKMIFTLTGKKLAKEILTQRPSEWWDKLWTAKRRQQ